MTVVAPGAAWMPIGELSRRVGVSADLLRKWERRYGVLRPGRTIGNRRLYSQVDEARLRFMLTHVRNGMPAAQAAELAAAARFRVTRGASVPAPRQDAAGARSRLLAATERFDETAADQALDALLVTGGAHLVVRDVLLPFMDEVGERWADATLTIAQEHFATQFAHARLLSLARGWDRGLGPRALLACAPGEQHTLGLIAFGIALHHVGWRITYLGADTPMAALVSAAETVEPRMIVVTAAMPGRAQPVLSALRQVAARWPLSLAGAGMTAQEAAEARATLLTTDPVTAALSALN